MQPDLGQVKVPIVFLVLDHEVVASGQLRFSTLHLHESQHRDQYTNLCLLLPHSGGHERGIVGQNFLSP